MEVLTTHNARKKDRLDRKNDKKESKIFGNEKKQNKHIYIIKLANLV